MSARKDQQGIGQETERIVAASLDLASKEPWEFVSFLDISRAAGVPVEDVRDLFPAKQDIPRYIVGRIDDAVIDSYKLDPAASKKDSLFDILMERFDAMDEHRAAQISFIQSFGWNNSESRTDFNFYLTSLERYLKAVGIGTEGMKGLANIWGLGAGYSFALYVWMQDESPDKTKTMAALDKTLGRLQRISNYVGV